MERHMTRSWIPLALGALLLAGGLLVLVGTGDVVWRGDDQGEVVDGGGIEAQGAEGSDLGHGTFG